MNEPSSAKEPRDEAGRQTEPKRERHARSGADPTTAPPSDAPAEQFYARENRKD